MKRLSLGFILLSLLIFTFQSCAPTHKNAPQFQDEYSQIELTASAQTDFETVLSAFKSLQSSILLEAGLSSSDLFQLNINDESGAKELAQLNIDECSFHTHIKPVTPLRTNQAFVVESNAECPLSIAYKVDFEYDLLAAKVLVQLQAEIYPRNPDAVIMKGSQSPYQLKGVLINGSGDFKFEKMGKQTRILGGYQLFGQLFEVSGRKIEVQFQNDVDALESQQDTLQGTLTSRLSLKSREHKLGLRSVTAVDAYTRSTHAYLNDTRVEAPQVESWLSDLGVFSPKYISFLGRHFSKR